MSVGEVGERLRRSTVHIRSGSRRRQSAGSGIIWSSDGTIVTNAHVIGDGGLEVELWDGTQFPAKLESRDDARDLAKLKLPAKNLPAAAIRESQVRPGEMVIAVGNPLGFTGALTTGVAHAIGPMAGIGRKRWVQAAIRLAPGNSGGPLADSGGRVIGINTMIVPGPIALAVPASVAVDFVSHGPSFRLGITVQPVALPQRGKVGLLILSVELGSAAEQASLLLGDLLTGIDGKGFEIPADLSDFLAEASGAVRLRFRRGDRSHEREVVIPLERGVKQAA